MTLFDVHAHFYPPIFTQTDIENCNVKVLAVAENLNDCKQILSLKTEHYFPCAGLHPIQDNQSVRYEQLQEVLEFIHLHHDSLKAIGEIGLDYSPHFMVGEAEKQVQQLIFKKLILVALQYQLPINVHSRNAGHYALECIQRTYMESGVTTQLFVIMHAFDGSLKYVRKVLKDPNILFYFSIPPCIVRLESFQNLVKVVPLERLLLESDSPALGPVKGIDNHPENISISCTEIAKIKQVSFEQVALQTNLNAQRIINVNIVNKDIIS